MSIRSRFMRAVSRLRRAVTPHRARFDAQAARVASAFKRKPPKVVDSTCSEHVCGKGGWSGRYDPKTHTVHRAMERRMPRKRRKALKGHEVAHGMVCDRKSKKCTYHGEHNARYYRTAVKVHRKLGTDPKEAVALEKMSGYRPPRWYEKALGRGK